MHTESAPAPATASVEALATAAPASCSAAPSSGVPLPQTPIDALPHLDPRFLALKSAAYAALADIFAAEDADYREKRLAATIVFKYAASIEPRPEPSHVAPAQRKSVPSGLSSASSASSTPAPEPTSSDPSVPPEWANTLRPEEVSRSPFATGDGSIPKHITDNHHVQHLQRLCYNHGYWSGFHNYKGTQKPPYRVTFASGTPEARACTPATPLGLVRPALANASCAADLVSRAGTAAPPS